MSYNRPNLESILIDTANKGRKFGNSQREVSVYSCAPEGFNNALRNICKRSSDYVPEVFAFYPEIFG